MFKEVITNNKSPWTTGQGIDSDVVLSSRLRLARNFNAYPFPLKQTAESGQKVLEMMAAFCQDSQELNFYDLQDVRPLDKQVLVEKHLISPEHSKDDEHYRGLAVDDEGMVSIMINEEDHLRIQCFAPGLDVGRLWQKASDLDDAIESRYDFAFDERLGYLTCCPTNLGNGLRASVMMHLPSLGSTKRIGILNQLSNIGMTVRGLFGEGSQSVGDLYQVSNQVTLGQTENDIITNLQSIAGQIIKEEHQAREFLQEHNGTQLEDQAWRALGVLTHSRYIDSVEALRLISALRLGYNMGYITHLTMPQITELYLIAQPAYLQVIKGKDMDEQEQNASRAAVLRAKLS